MIKKSAFKIIEFYQIFISPGLGHNCRFYPGCSSYFMEKIKKEGLLRGSFKGFWRILKCNPFTKGGIDLP
jgi:uncharacterized protein